MKRDFPLTHQKLNLNDVNCLIMMLDYVLGHITEQSGADFWSLAIVFILQQNTDTNQVSPNLFFS